MFEVRAGEDSERRAKRRAIEAAVREEVIKNRDGSDAPTEAERVALGQMNAQARRLPLDYALILKHRAEAPGLFVHLPSDEACRQALGIVQETNVVRDGDTINFEEPLTARDGETVEIEDDKARVVSRKRK